MESFQLNTCVSYLLLHTLPLIITTEHISHTVSNRDIPTVFRRSRAPTERPLSPVDPGRDLDLIEKAAHRSVLFLRFLSVQGGERERQVVFTNALIGNSVLYTPSDPDSLDFKSHRVVMFPGL